MRMTRMGTQPYQDSNGACKQNLRYFVLMTNIIDSGRIIMEANIPPIIIPMWLTGFEKVMPEGRPFPYKYMPQFGTHISITFGDPLNKNDIQDTLGLAHKIKPRPQDPAFKSESETELDDVRLDITEIIRTAVLVLGRKVSGPTLSKFPT
jgi:monolysocardiolipin acyltransferase